MKAACRILVVDESTVTRMLALLAFSSRPDVFVRIESDSAHAIEEAHNAIARGAPYDLFFFDLGAAAANGWQLVEQLRAEPQHRATPMLLLSNDDSPEAARAARRFAAGLLNRRPATGFVEALERFVAERLRQR